MAPRKKPQKVREVIGIFFDETHLKAAIADLMDSGFNYEQLGLLAGEEVIEKSLDDIYRRTSERGEDAIAPSTAFVKKRSVGDTFRALEGSLFFAGSTTALGAAVASAAVFGGALITAIAGAVSVGAVGGVLGSIIHQSDAEYLEQQIDDGNLLLFVRAADLEKEQNAIDILSRHSGFDVRVYQVPVKLEKPTS